jgi:hypothetical protein
MNIGQCSTILMYLCSKTLQGVRHSKSAAATPRMSARRDREIQEVALGPPEATPIPPMRWGSRRGGRCGAAPSTGTGWLKPADPDVGNAGNGHTSDRDDDDDRNEPKTDGCDKNRRRDATGGQKRPQGRQTAGGQAAAGGDGSPVCTEVAHSAGMRLEGRAMAGSLSAPHPSSIIYFVFFFTYFLCIY